MRNITLEDKKLEKILRERGNVLTEAQKITKEIEKLQKEQQKLGYKMERLKEKTVPLMEKHQGEFELGEFELVSRVYINEETDKPTAEIADQIEEYKKFLREKNEADGDNSDN